MQLITIIGLLAGICTAISLVPQLVKVIKEKEAESVSYVTLGILFSGLALWIYYGMLAPDPIIVVANSFSLLINLVLTGFTIKYKSNPA